MTVERSSPPHWIKHNAISRVPSRFVFFDTEAYERHDGETRVQTFRLAVTALDTRQRGSMPWRPTVWKVHNDAEALWSYIGNTTLARMRTIVVAHNLAYDLRTSNAFHHLAQRRWQLTRLSLHDRAVSATFARDGRTLVLCDSMAFLPMKLADIGALVGTRKADIPEWDVTDDEWVHRATVDVSILRRAVLDLVRWVEDDDLGNWQKTGAGQAWSTWRHKHYTHRVLVHDDVGARAAEATACYTGRCEAWRHGRLRDGPYGHWDLPAAYSRVALDLMVPVRLLGHGTRRRFDTITSRPLSRRFLCRATVTTDVPVLPVKVEGNTAWPVGTFAGWWWDDELQMVVDHGGTVTIDETYSYAAAPALRAWAQWIVAQSSDESVQPVAVRRAFAKHMARALIGRFATKFTSWDFDSPADELRETVERVHYADTDESGRLLTLGRQTWQGMGEQYGRDVCVFVMSAVMAECRRRLWQVMLCAGLDHVVYVDTDGLYVDATGDEALTVHSANGGLWGLRKKADHERLQIMGPRQLVVDGGAQIAGVPKGARRVNGTTWAGEVWQTLPEALRTGNADAVRIVPRRWTIKGTDHRRVHNADGTTSPLLAEHWPRTDAAAASA